MRCSRKNHEEVDDLWWWKGRSHREVDEKDKVGWFFKLFLLMFIPDIFGEDWKLETMTYIFGRLGGQKPLATCG